MPDPLTALGAAVAIVQLLDIGFRIVAGAGEIYKSGSKTELYELKLIVEEVKRSNAALGQIPAYYLFRDESLLRQLATTAEHLAERLEKKLAKLIVPHDVRFRMVKSAKASMESALKSNEIQAMKERLIDMQRLVQERTHSIARSAEISGLDSAIQAVNDQNARIGVSTHAKLNQLVSSLQQLARTEQDRNSDRHSFLTSLVKTINDTIAEAKQATENEKIIASLWFHVLKDRHDRIDIAYDETLNWLYDRQKTTLSQWLIYGEGI